MERPYIVHVLGASQDLFYLAEFYYGDAAKWHVIYHENLDLIGDDPEQLSSGMALRIPMVGTSEERGAMPVYIPATPCEASKDPLVQFCENRYGDPCMIFDLLERNRLEGDEVVAPGTALRFPARGEKRNLALALIWREKFGGN